MMMLLFSEIRVGSESRVILLLQVSTCSSYYKYLLQVLVETTTSTYYQQLLQVLTTSTYYKYLLQVLVVVTTRTCSSYYKGLQQLLQGLAVSTCSNYQQYVLAVLTVITRDSDPTKGMTMMTILHDNIVRCEHFLAILFSFLNLNLKKIYTNTDSLCSLR